MGTPDKHTFPATFYWLTDDETDYVTVSGSYCTWADVRRDNPTRSAEFHLYYAADSEPVVHRAKAGDLLVIARRKDGSLIVILTPNGSTISSQLLWLFGLSPIDGKPSVRELGTNSNITLSFAAIKVLEDIGIEVEDPQPNAFGQLIETFGLNFPPTALLSQFARDTLMDVDPVSAPDDTLLAWVEHEEALFRHMEKQVLAERLKAGFVNESEVDVDGFLKFSLSVQNRRKSRAGYAFGHHIEAILTANSIVFKREATTEKRNAADFLFPSEEDYANPDFPNNQLTMLAAKTTCKDRWRQVLAEADRIQEKHLLTLEPAISRAQTDEMIKQGLSLVLPKPIHETYQKDQKEWLLGVCDFLSLVKAPN